MLTTDLPPSWPNDMSLEGRDVQSELIRLPALVARYGEIAANASRDLAAIKGDLKILEAEVYAERKAYYDAKKEKATIELLKTEVMLDPRIQTLTQRQRTQEHVLALTRVACESLDAKQSSLRMLVKLHLAELGVLADVDTEERRSGARPAWQLPDTAAPATGFSAPSSTLVRAEKQAAQATHAVIVDKTRATFSRTGGPFGPR